MKRLVLSLLSLCLLSPSLLADGTTDLIKKQAQLSMDAFKAGDFGSLADSTSPRVIAMMGGKDKMVSSVKTLMEGVEAKGFKVETLELGEPGEIKKVGTFSLCLIPKKMIMKIPRGHLTSDSHLLAISEDDGKTFKFIDIASVEQTQFDTIFPELKGQFTLPEKKQPLIDKSE